MNIMYVVATHIQGTEDLGVVLLPPTNHAIGCPHMEHVMDHLLGLSKEYCEDAQPCIIKFTNWQEMLVKGTGGRLAYRFTENGISAFAEIPPHAKYEVIFDERFWEPNYQPNGKVS